MDRQVEHRHDVGEEARVIVLLQRDADLQPVVRID
jgi:hypothetical protein